MFGTNVRACCFVEHILMAEKRAKAWIFGAVTGYHKYLPERFHSAKIRGLEDEEKKRG